MMLRLRTALFVPGNRPDRIEKALRSEADAVIIDLEDSVPPAEKAGARAMVREKASYFGKKPVLVRVNALGSPFFQEDLEETTLRKVTGIMLPKVEKPADVHAIHQHLLEVEKRKGYPPGHFRVFPLIESAAAIRHIHDIASTKTSPERLYTVAFGAADYTLDLGIEMTREGEELLYPRSRIVVACRAAGIAPPIDTPFMLDLSDLDGLIADATRAKRLGFQGKLVIHPRQIEPCNRIFSPSPNQIARAKEIVRAYEEATSRGTAAIKLGGTFIDVPVVRQAKRLLSLAAEIGLLSPVDSSSTRENGSTS